MFVLQCMIHTWYIAVDAQLYFLSPVLLIPLKNWPRFGLGLTFAALIAAFFTSFGIAYVNEEHVYIYYTNNIME
jgi:peptidoglycan/LPS O-acetylase OafA/YrhL